MNEWNFQRTIAQGVVLGLVAAGMFYLVYQAILHTLWREVGANDNVTQGHDDGLGREFGGSGHEEAGSGGET